MNEKPEENEETKEMMTEVRTETPLIGTSSSAPTAPPATTYRPVRYTRTFRNGGSVFADANARKARAWSGVGNQAQTSSGIPPPAIVIPFIMRPGPAEIGTESLLERMRGDAIRNWPNSQDVDIEWMWGDAARGD